MLRSTRRVASAFLVLAALGTGLEAAAPANPDASASTTAVLSYLTALPGGPDRRVISAQHLAHSSAYSSEGYADFVIQLQTQTGSWVGMIAVDYGLGTAGEIAATNQILIDYWNAGGLVSIDMHPNNPWTGGDSWDLAQRDLVDLITPGTTVNNVWMQQLDVMAVGLAELRDAGVVVLWRPFHEMTFLSTFWWDAGAHYPDVEPWRAMWRHMFDYFTGVKGLNNLLWVYAAANEGQWRPADLCYPGDAYVDIVGVDAYDDEPVIYGSAYQDLLDTGKPFALTECGPSTRDGSYDNTLMIDTIRDDYPQSVYALHWHSWPGANVAIVDNQNASDYLDDPWIVTRDELDWGSAAEIPTSGNWKLDDAGGLIAEDSSGNANHGTLVNGPVWTGGLLGGALQFDGDDDYVEIPDATALRDVQESSFSLAAWYRPAVTPPGSGADWNASHGIVMKRGYHLGLRYGGDSRFYMDHWLVGDVYVGVGSSGTFPPGVYHHVVGTLDLPLGELRLYVDGQLQGQAAWTGGTPTREFGSEPWRIGTADPSTHLNWAAPADGRIDDVRIYDRRLSAADVAALATSCVSGGTPSAITDLRFAGDAQTVTWSAVTGAGGYDVVKGALESLLSSGGDFGGSLTGCLVEYSGATQAGDTGVPTLGAGFYYLARAVSCLDEAGTYDSGGDAQVAPRDAAIDISSSACP